MQPEIDPAFASIKKPVDVSALVNGWAQLWGANELMSCTIRVNRRLSRSLGLCRPARRCIDINPVLLDPRNENLLIETLCHEAAHLVIHDRYGRSARPHGHEWSALMADAGHVARAGIPSDQISGQLKKPKRTRYEYRHYCSDCDAVMTARRTSHRWRCSVCVNAGRDGYLDVTRRAI